MELWDMNWDDYPCRIDYDDDVNGARVLELNELFGGRIYHRAPQFDTEVPYLNGFVADRPLTDFIRFIHIQCVVVKDEVYERMRELRLPKHTLHPVSFTCKGVSGSCQYLCWREDVLDYVDFRKCLFWEKGNGTGTRELTIANKEEYLELAASDLVFRFSRVKFTNGYVPFDLFFVNGFGATFVSSRFKEWYEGNDYTGWYFTKSFRLIE